MKKKTLQTGDRLGWCLLKELLWMMEYIHCILGRSGWIITPWCYTEVSAVYHDQPETTVHLSKSQVAHGNISIKNCFLNIWFAIRRLNNYKLYTEGFSKGMQVTKSVKWNEMYKWKDDIKYPGHEPKLICAKD